MVRLPGLRSTKRSDPGVIAGKNLNDDSLYSRADIKKETRARQLWSIAAAVCLFITLIFLIVVEVGNTHNIAGLRNIWFIRLDLSNVVPSSVGPQAQLLNTIARTLGLHDFYQVGLWNFCEGYEDEGVTHCSSPHTLYAFDPVQIITAELLSGSNIQLPAELSDVLDIIKTASEWMFGLFLAGTCLSFVSMLLMPFAVVSRWVALSLTLVTFINGVVVVAATVIATVMFIIMRNVFLNNTTVHIGAENGVVMFALMWVASAFTVGAFVIQLCLTCCCTSRRDVRRRRRRRSST